MVHATLREEFMGKISLVVVGVMLILIATPVLAQNTAAQATPADNYAQMQKLMKARYAATASPIGMYPNIMSKEKIEKFMQSLIEMGLLYKLVAQPTMVSVDNGIVVAYGNTLRKYDKDLNAVKEVKLDVNVDEMEDLAAKFAKKYSSDVMDLIGSAKITPTPSPSAMSGNFPSTPAATSSANPAKAYDQKEEEIKKEIAQIK